MPTNHPMVAPKQVEQQQTYIVKSTAGTVGCSVRAFYQGFPAVTFP